MSKKPLLLVALNALMLLFLVESVQAVPTQVVHVDVPHCDTLNIPFDVDEIGNFIFFPPGEQLEHIYRGPTADSPCPQFDNPTLTNELVEITNFNNHDLAEVWYVANDGTSITNFDGFADDAAFPITPNHRGHHAFRIDNLVSDPNGAHHPLVSESFIVDGIWQAGETWQFVLQDYSNTAGLAPDAFDSIGVGTASTFTPGTAPSSGSIIAIVPEPASLGLGCLGLLIAGGWRRRV